MKAIGTSKLHIGISQQRISNVSVGKWTVS